MEQCLAATSEGRSRKEREAARREDELTAALRAEDARIAKEQEINEKAARDAATATSSSDKNPPEPIEVSPDVAHQRDEVPEHVHEEMIVDPWPAKTDSEMFATDRYPMTVIGPDDPAPPTPTRVGKRGKPR